jgi:hypothetical protein
MGPGGFYKMLQLLRFAARGGLLDLLLGKLGLERVRESGRGLG